MAIKRRPPDWREELAALRQRFILTRQEKKLIVFVFAAFVLGVGAKYYRETHPQPPPSFDTKHPWKTRATTTPSSTPQKAQRKSRRKKQSATPLPSPSAAKEDEGGSSNF